MKILTLSLIALTFTACATPPKMNAVPMIDGATLPTINTTNVRPKALMIEVTNTRAINKVSQNSTQVASSIQDTLNTVAERSGLAQGKTINLWRVELQDCPEAPKAEGVSEKEYQDTVCVRIKHNFSTASIKYEGSAFATNYTQRGKGTWTRTGDVNDAYFNALSSLINGMNEKISKAEKKQ